MISPAQAKRDRKALHKAIAKDLKAKARAKVVDLRTAVRLAKKARKALHAEAAARCKASRREARERAKARKRAAVSELNAAARQERELNRFQCSTGKAKAREAGKGGWARAVAELTAERKYQREIKGIERAQKKHRPAGISKAHRRSESDDEVRQNLDPHLIGLFEKVKRGIKGSDRMSRTEAFLKYAEENPGEVLGAIDDVAEERIRQLEKAHREAQRVAKRSKRGSAAAALSEVPF